MRMVSFQWSMAQAGEVYPRSHLLVGGPDTTLQIVNHAGFTSFRWARGASILQTSSDLGDRLLGGLKHPESLAIEPNLKKAADRSMGAIHQESVYGAGGRLVKTNPLPEP
jgi:hypothetical protein